MTNLKQVDCDLLIIGAGMAGMAAAVFAAKRGISTVQCGSSGGLLFASGLLDLLGVFPVENGRTWDNPWDAIDTLTASSPDHPYARVGRETIRESFLELAAFMSDAGLPYRFQPHANSTVLTGLGTCKPTYGVPLSMWPGASALSDTPPCLLVDFKGLKEYSARQIVEIHKKSWPDLRAVRVTFPGTGKTAELYPEQLARSLEGEEIRVKLAKTIKKQLRGETCVGLPAVLGIYQTSAIMAEMEALLGVQVFEIATPMVSVPGLRIHEKVQLKLPPDKIRQFFSTRIERVESSTDNGFRLHARTMQETIAIHARGIILAGGRFLGQGLSADRFRIRETLFDLPVTQPAKRDDWHSLDFFERSGHPINRAGLEIDRSFRPLDRGGEPAYDHLFAAGSILAHQDWIREKSGSGIAIATAFAAVNAFFRQQ
ncbi:glycerol-3-phosphate dehydrogenase subunit GlpB [bacterium]|nr:glycerol-3-phosphate dehydrogenase subunit GlpB [bacterium]